MTTKPRQLLKTMAAGQSHYHLFVFIVLLLLQQLSWKTDTIVQKYVVAVSAFSTTLAVPTKLEHNRQRRASHWGQCSALKRRSIERNNLQNVIINIRGGSSMINTNSTTSYSGIDRQERFAQKTADLLGNVRIPAALFAGASAGSAFALPQYSVTDGFKLGMVKRMYSLMMIGSLSSQIVAVVVSTFTMNAISTRRQQQSHDSIQGHNNSTEKISVASSLEEYIQKHYNLEWISIRLHFLSGVILFTMGIGLRAWISIACPIVARAALGIVISTTMLCLSFLSSQHQQQPFYLLPVRYLQALVQKSKQSWMFSLSLSLTLITALYILGNVPHVFAFLTAVS